MLLRLLYQYNLICWKTLLRGLCIPLAIGQVWFTIVLNDNIHRVYTSFFSSVLLLLFHVKSFWNSWPIKDLLQYVVLDDTLSWYFMLTHCINSHFRVSDSRTARTLVLTHLYENHGDPNKRSQMIRVYTFFIYNYIIATNQRVVAASTRVGCCYD